jgi:hypothetical protein
LSVAATLPLVAALLLYRCFRPRWVPDAALVRTAVLWGVLVFAITELLSALRLLRPWPLAAVWALVTAAFLALALRLRRSPGSLHAASSTLPAWALIPAALSLAVTLIVALVAPPNSTDSMTYHLTRVAVWIQRESIEPYATSTIRQAFMPVWAGYAVLNFQLLAGGSDRFAPLVQWLAFAGTLPLSAGIARRLGADRSAQGLAVLCAATAPMVVVQASSTQVDLVTAFWCAAFVWAAVDVRERRGAETVLLPGAALGLAVATKGTALVVCAPFALGWLLDRVTVGGWRRGLAAACGLGATALALNAPIFVRNLRMFDHPLGPASQRTALGNESHGPGALASNLLRNATLHLAAPGDGRWNATLANGVVRLHQAAGLDPSDPRTTWHENRFGIRPLRTKESRTGNPVHFVLALLSLLLLVRRGSPPLQRRYALALAGAALLFCWAFKWQQWHARLHTPLFVLAAPLVAAVLGRSLPARATAGLGLTLWCLSLPWLLVNESRPLVSLKALTVTPGILETPRERQYFVEDLEIEQPYRRVVEALTRRRCARLGVAGVEKTGIYPLVPLTRQRGTHLELWYIGVPNETRVLEERPQVCAILADGQAPDWRPPPPYETMRLAWRTERVALWLAPGGG